MIAASRVRKNIFKLVEKEQAALLSVCERRLELSRSQKQLNCQA